MQIHGWLLNADYITKKNSAVVRLWVKRKNGEVGVILDKDFDPYFYVVPKEEAAVNKVIQDLRNHETERYSETIKPKKIIQEQKKDFGEKKKVIKLITNHPQHVPSLRKSISELNEVKEVREADIPFVNRYIIDKGLKPSSKIKVIGEETQINKVDFAIKAQKVSESTKNNNIPIKTLAFDCEMFNRGGTPNPDNDPIIIISLKTSSGNTKVLKAKKRDDKDIIKEFIKTIKNEDPDVIVTFNGDEFDWPYLRKRAEKHDIQLEVGRDKSTPQWHGGARKKVAIKGRLNVDLYRIAERDIGEVKMMSLEEVADFLGVKSKDDRCNLEGSLIGEYWKDKEKRNKLFRYARDDVESTYGIANELVPTQIEISKMIKQFLDKVSKMGRGRQVEWYLMAEAYLQNELIPNKGNYAARSQETYSGGFVLEPKRGLHEDVVSLDFSSMYPSLMVSYNISPDTLISEEENKELQENEYYEAPEVHHKFKKKPNGFFKSILKDLINRRNKIKEKMNNNDSEQETRLLNIRQKALKTLTNSFYGYTGWSAARWYKKECAEATTAWGREMIKKGIETAENEGFEVIYSDTDSIFVKYPDSRDKVKEKSEELAEKLTKELPLILEVEDYFKTIFFTENKKRYAGLKSNEDIYIRGLEVRRGDWCKLAKKIQKKVISKILKEKDPDSALELVKKTVNDIKNGNVLYGDLIIRKTLKKKISNYKSMQAHVKAAKKAKRNGYEIAPGGKVGFIVITRTGETVGERAYPTEMIKDYEKGKLEIEGRGGEYFIDKEYYIENQIIPAVSRVLSYFGYSKNEMKGEPSQQTFGDFN